MAIKKGTSSPVDIRYGSTQLKRIVKRVNGIEKELWSPTPSTTTTYANFNVYNIESEWRNNYEYQEEVDIMDVHGVEQTIEQGGTIISTDYLACGYGYDMGCNYGCGSVLVFFKTNSNADILDYKIKSENDLGPDFYTYMDAFQDADYMTDSIWNTVAGYFSTIVTITVSTSGGIVYIDDGSTTIEVDSSTHAMNYNGQLWTNDTQTEYATISSNGWLVDGTYQYPSGSQDWIDVVNSIKTKSEVVLTITTTTSGGKQLISDGSRSILYDASTQKFKYNANYYTEETVASAYTFLNSVGWLTNGTYQYASVSSNIQSWEDTIAAVKAAGVSNATITHNSATGEITISNVQWSITIADKNVGATQVWNSGDTITQTNAGYYYQRGNNYGFPGPGQSTPSTSSTKVNIEGYGPSNYYNSSTFILKETWFEGASASRANLWGNTTNTDAARQGPCSSGRHIPSTSEAQFLLDLYHTIRPNGDITADLKIPKAGQRRTYDGATQQINNLCGLFTSEYDTNSALIKHIHITDNDAHMSTGYPGVAISVRPFKNTSN